MSICLMVAYAIIITCLILSGYSDYKTRTVSNIYPFLIFVTGFFIPGPWMSKLLGAILPLFIVIIASKILKQKSGGADIKMYVALGFAFGFVPFVFIIAGALLFAVIVNLIKKRSVKETIPMCTYLSASAIMCIATYSML